MPKPRCVCKFEIDYDARAKGAEYSCSNPAKDKEGDPFKGRHYRSSTPPGTVTIAKPGRPGTAVKLPKMRNLTPEEIETLRIGPGVPETSGTSPGGQTQDQPRDDPKKNKQKKQSKRKPLHARRKWYRRGKKDGSSDS